MHLVYSPWSQCKDAVLAAAEDRAAGHLVTDRDGTIEALELRVGLARSPISPGLRIATYAARLRRTVIDDETAFYARAFESDPWATAAELLDRRDTLVLGGLDFARLSSSAPKRLVDLARVERCAEPALPAGPGERVAALVATLEGGADPELEGFRVMLPEDLLPPWLERLRRALALTTRVDFDVPTAQASPETDLRRLQDRLLGGSPPAFVNDGTVRLVTAVAESEAADSGAAWIAALDRTPGRTAVLIQDGGSHLLDQHLRHQGQPIIGRSRRAPARGRLALLPLLFRLQWRPLDPRAMIQWLSVPKGPLPKRERLTLRRALLETPGIRSQKWHDAWTRIREDVHQRLASNTDGEIALDGPEVERRLNELRSWVETAEASPEIGLDAVQAKTLAERLAAWATARAATIAADADDAERHDLAALAGAATELARLIDAFAADCLPRPLMERLVQQALGAGADDGGHCSEASPRHLVEHPGALAGAVDHLLWWTFTDPDERTGFGPWARSERETLAASGCTLDPPSRQAARIAAAHARAVLLVRNTLVLIQPVRRGLDELAVHPLAQRLGQASLLDPIHEDAAAVRAMPEIRLGEAVITRQPSPPSSLPVAQSDWDLPAPIVARLTDRVDTVSGLERLVDCQLRWLLEDALHVRRSPLLDLVDGARLLGNVAHALVAELFRPGPAQDPAVVEEEARRRLPDLVEATALPLLQPGEAEDRARAQERMPRALAFLARLMRDHDLEVGAVEQPLDGELAPDLRVRGRLDLRATGARDAVFDLKWAGRGTTGRHRKRLQTGRAFQLALYPAMFEAPSEPESAYVMLGDDQVLAGPGSPFATHTIEDAPDLGTVRADLLATWERLRAEALGGRIRATGVPGAASADVAIKPDKNPCRYCPATPLCRIERGRR